jgi:hypothetical protein
VLLPLSGPSGHLGTGIQHAIEIAFFQQQPRNILVNFHDLSGRTEEKRRLIEMVLAAKPDLIIGPLLADDVELLKELKPRHIPAITFTSANRVLGNGIFTLALLPNQPVEAIVRHMAAEDRERLIIIAPDTATGHMLSNTALESARIHGLETAGLYFFEEHNSGDMKSIAEKVSLYESRVANLTRAKEILSDVLINQTLTPSERESVREQLDELNRRDSLGTVPYDAVLFLGNAADSKTLASFLRYYDVTPAMAPFYGSALWDTESVHRDSSLAGGQFATLVRMDNDFAKLFSDVKGTRPNRFDTIGYDAAMLAIRSLGSGKIGAHLLDSSGYRGIDGLFRLRPNGENERALQIMQLNGVRAPMVKRAAPSNFTTPLYRTKYNPERPRPRRLSSAGFNPGDYIRLPEHVRGQYRTRAIGAIHDESSAAEEIMAVPEWDEDAIIDESFQPSMPAAVNRRQIDEVRMRQ